MMRWMVGMGCMVLVLVGALTCLSAAPPIATRPSWDKALRSNGVSSSFDPATAKRGQTVTLRLQVELDPEYHTYSFVQTDPDLVDSVPTFEFSGLLPELVKAGAPTEHATEQKTIKGSNGLFGKVELAQQFVVRPDAAVGEKVWRGKVRFQVCNENACLPTRTFNVEATLNIGDAPAVPVDPKYADVVKGSRTVLPPGPPPPEPKRTQPTPVAVRPEGGDGTSAAATAADSAAAHECAGRVSDQLEAQKAAQPVPWRSSWPASSGGRSRW